MLIAIRFAFLGIAIILIDCILNAPVMTPIRGSVMGTLAGVSLMAFIVSLEVKR